MELLRFQFIVVHIPKRMLTDCDMLSQYNTRANALQNGPTTQLTVHKTYTRSTKESKPRNDSTYDGRCKPIA